MKPNDGTIRPLQQQPSRSRLAVAAALGVGFPLFQRMVYSLWPSVDPLVELPIVVVAYFFGLAGLSLPYRNYPAVLKLGAATAAGFAIHAGFSLALKEHEGWGSYTWVTVVGVPTLLIGTFAANAVVLCTFNWLRTRFWPCFPPGHCARCGYCLFGLPTQRCPECGTPFEHSTCSEDCAVMGVDKLQSREFRTKEHVGSNE